MIQLREHQNSAVNYALQHNIAQIILPTGTGKSFIQDEIINRLIQQKDDSDSPPVFVIVSPRILLSFQHLENSAKYLSAKNIQCAYLNVNSGVFDENEIAKIIDKCGLQSYSIKSTTNFSEIEEVYRFCRMNNQPLVISSTYDSVDQIQKSRIDIDSYIFDEAHYIVSSKNEEVTRYDAKRRYFFTATPKVTDSDDGLGMNNTERFSDNIFRIAPKKLIEKGEMVKPAIHYVGISGSYNLSKDHSVNYDYKNIVNGILSAFDCHSKAVCKYSANTENIAAKMLVTLEGQRQLEGVMETPELKEFRSNNPDVHIYALASDVGIFFQGKRYKNSNKAKEELFNHIQSLENTDKAIIFHVDMLSEGIDVPGITGVMPLRNLGKTKLLQNVGRSIRLVKDDREKLYNDVIKPMNWVDYTKPYAWVIIPHFVDDGADLCERYKTIIKELRGEYDFDVNDFVILNNANSATELEEIDEVGQRDREIRSISHKTVEFINQLEEEEKLDILIEQYFRTNGLEDLDKGILWKTILKDYSLLYESGNIEYNIPDTLSDIVKNVALEWSNISGYRGIEGIELRRHIISHCLSYGEQSIHTPFDLCFSMLNKLDSCIDNMGEDLREKKIAVLFNVEFVESLIFDFGVPPENITFFADSKSELSWVLHGYKLGKYGDNVFY